jgi:hypothetical protein
MHLRDKLSCYWNMIQENLFPWLEESLGPLTQKQQQLVTVLEFARVEEFLSRYTGLVGRPEENRTTIARAFVAKAVYNLPTTVHLLDRLRCDKVFRRLCGWEKSSDIPSESTFSRAFSEFSKSALAERVHSALIKNYQSDCLIGHISRDSTAIEAREKVLFKEKVEITVMAPKKRGRPKKEEIRPEKEPTRLERQTTMTLKEMFDDLPKACDIGTKKNSKGFKVSWKGYKFHIDTADNMIPISAILTSASTHDSQVAIPLALTTNQRVTNLYDLMDAAYDSKIIRDHSQSLGHVPLIDFNRRTEKDVRSFMPHEAERYKERSTAERINARLKDEFGGITVRVKGHFKVLSHLMFGLIALTVDQLVRLMT